VDAAGSNVYIADTRNNAIKVWNAASGHLEPLVSEGLQLPFGVAVDAAGNVYIADTVHHAIKEWNATTQDVVTLVTTELGAPSGVAVDGAGNVYFSDGADNTIKEWIAASGLVSPLVSTGLDTPNGVAEDGAGHVHFADSHNNAIKTLTRAFVPGDFVSEGAAAGSDHLLPVLPTGQSLTGLFAPRSDQSWLTLDASADGVVHFSFTANTGVARTAHITLLGQSITMTQAAPRVTPSLTWSDPADITYGTPLGAAQLDATADVPGTFTYTPAAGKVLNAGPNQPLFVQFTPDDPVKYTTATKMVTINVLKADTTTTVMDAGGTYDGTTAFAASAAVTGAGKITGNPKVTYFDNTTSKNLGTTAPINAGNYTATATHAGDANHNGSSASVTFDILKAPLRRSRRAWRRPRTTARPTPAVRAR
jgi:hypothetical protein